MTHLRHVPALIALAYCFPSTAVAQTAAPTYLKGSTLTTADAMMVIDKSGNPLGTNTNPLDVVCTSGCSGGGGGAVTQSGSWNVGLVGSGNMLTINSSGQAQVYDASTAALAAAISAPIPAQSGHVVIGAVQGETAANSPGTYPVTVQPQSGGFAVLPATNSTGTVSQVQSDSSAAISVSTATTTQLVALSSGKAIYVTAWDIVVAAADNVTLEYGTGTNCGTGTTALTGAYNFAANGGLAKGSGLGVLFKVPAGNALCIVTSAAVQASGSVSYAQF